MVDQIYLWFNGEESNFFFSGERDRIFVYYVFCGGCKLIPISS